MVEQKVAGTKVSQSVYGQILQKASEDNVTVSVYLRNLIIKDLTGALCYSEGGEIDQLQNKIKQGNNNNICVGEAFDKRNNLLFELHSIYRVVFHETLTLRESLKTAIYDKHNSKLILEKRLEVIEDDLRSVIKELGDLVGIKREYNFKEFLKSHDEK